MGEDAVAVCGDARDELGVSVSVSVGLYCGDCDELKGLYTGLLGLLDAGTFDVGYVDQALALSLIDDGGCFDGFGGAQIDSARMVLTDSDGVEIPGTEIGTDGASMPSLVAVEARDVGRCTLHCRCSALMFRLRLDWKSVKR